MPKTIINTSSDSISFKELAHYKELFWMLALRDFKIRYAQTFLGILWAFIQPAATLLILYIVFGRFAQINTFNIPSLIFITCGLVPWTYFSYVMQNSSSSVISAQAMVKKIYFPRIIIPLSKALVGFIDLTISLVLLSILLMIWKTPVSPNIWAAPLFLFATVILSLGAGIWLSALSIRFRDVQYVVPFMIQLGLYITPTAYPAEFAISKLPEWATILYFLNPMAGIVEGFRWSLLDTPFPDSLSLISACSGLIIFLSSIFYFKKIDSTIADIV